MAAEARTLQHLSIHQTGDQDYFRLQAPANGPLIVELDSHRDAGDLDLYLYDSKGGLIAAAKTLDPIERIEHEVTKDTVYYLRVALTRARCIPITT